MKDTGNSDGSSSATPGLNLGKSAINASGAIALNIVWIMFIFAVVTGLVVSLSQIEFLNLWYFITVIIISSLTIVMLVWIFINEVLPRGLDACYSYWKYINTTRAN